MASPQAPSGGATGSVRRLGRYEILVRLAAGGAANVFLVRDLKSVDSGRLLALKVLLPSLASNDDFLRMFFTEARIAARLQHPNAVGIEGFGQAEGIHCLAMEYVFGASLSQVLKQSARVKKPLTVGVLLRITASVCDALHNAHELRDEDGKPMGLVHRDVTPQNILIGFNGIPKLTDFGIAKATGRGWETQAGIVKGKFSYMSPEQALGKKVDRRSDIFCTGIVLWEALTGKELFKGTSPMEVIEAIREQTIDPPSKVVPGLSSIVDPIVMKALKRSPRQRYQTAAEMRQDIEDLIARAGVQIDAATIAREFKDIYGELVVERATALRRAMTGHADLDELARVLGAQRLRDDHLPVIPGGASHPDPLGLFHDVAEFTELDEAAAEEDSSALPARQEAAFTNALPAIDIELDEPADEDEDDATRDASEEEEELQGFDEYPPITSDGDAGMAGWEDHTRAVAPSEELLAMIAESDATMGMTSAILDPASGVRPGLSARGLPYRSSGSGGSSPASSAGIQADRRSRLPLPERLDDVDRTDGSFPTPSREFEEEEYTMDASRPGLLNEPLLPVGTRRGGAAEFDWDAHGVTAVPNMPSPFDHSPPTLAGPAQVLKPSATRFSGTSEVRSSRPVPRAPSLDMAEIATPRPELERASSPPPPPPPPPPAPRKLTLNPKTPAPISGSGVAPPPPLSLPPIAPQPLDASDEEGMSMPGPPVVRAPSLMPRPAASGPGDPAEDVFRVGAAAELSPAALRELIASDGLAAPSVPVPAVARGRAPPPVVLPTDPPHAADGIRLRLTGIVALAVLFVAVGVALGVLLVRVLF